MFAAVLLNPVSVMGQEAPISLNADPEFPSRGDEVTVEAATPTFDKNTAIFNWKINGKSRPEISGLGQNTYTYTAGEIGSAMTIKVKVETLDGRKAQAEKTIYAADLALTWSAETYVPRWYKGKALPVPNSMVNVSAIPNFVLDGRIVPPSVLIYRWTIDESRVARESLGRQTLRFQMADFNGASHVVGVTVEDPARQISKQAYLTINSASPRVLVYKASPLGGIEHRFAQADVSASLNKILDLVSEPFFFATRSKINLFYRWLIAGSDIQGQPRDPSVLTIDTGKEKRENIPVSLYVENRQEAGLPVSKNFNLTLE